MECTNEVREKTIHELVDEQNYDMIAKRINELEQRLKDEYEGHRADQKMLMLEQSKVKALATYIMNHEYQY